MSEMNYGENFDPGDRSTWDTALRSPERDSSFDASDPQTYEDFLPELLADLDYEPVCKVSLDDRNALKAPSHYSRYLGSIAV